MAANEPVCTVRVGPQGRIVIPAELRRALGVQTGEELVARADEGRLVLERRDTVLLRLQGLFAHVPPEISLADELIEERRAEARRELANE
jgi:AbrB family looped-hinge helix DNA binding protein